MGRIQTAGDIKHNSCSLRNHYSNISKIDIQTINLVYIQHLCLVAISETAPCNAVQQGNLPSLPVNHVEPCDKIGIWSVGRYPQFHLYFSHNPERLAERVGAVYQNILPFLLFLRVIRKQHAALMILVFR